MPNPPINKKSPAPQKPGLLSLSQQQLDAAIENHSQGPGLRTMQTDTSKYDEGFIMGGNDGVQLNEQRADRQTTGDKFKNGLVKMGGTAVTSFLEPFVDLTVGAASAGMAAANGEDMGAAVRKSYDNWGTQTLDSLNNYLQKEYPNYASQKEQNMGLLEEATTANFWADKVGNGLGFMLGAVASGALTGGAADAIKAGRLAKALALAADVEKAAKEGSAIVGALGKAAVSTTRRQALQTAVVGTVGAMGESGMEARQIAHDTGVAVRKQLMTDSGLNPEDYENHTFTGAQEAHIKDLEEAAGNTGFLYNMVLTGTANALLLPKVFRKGYQAERAALSSILPNAETGLYEAALLTGKQKALKAVKNVALNNLEEATQEQLQFALEKALPDYYRKQRDPEAQGDFTEYLTSMGQGMAQAYGTKEGLENGLLGAIIGFAGVKGSVQEVGAGERTTQAAVATVNAAILRKPQQAMMNALVGQTAALKQQHKAVRDGDQLQFQNAEFESFAHLVRGHAQAGKLDDLLESIRKEGELTPDEYKEKYGLAATDQLAASPAQLAAKQVTKAQELAKLSDEIEGAYPGEGQQPLRDAFFGISAQMQNAGEREQKMANELAKLTGISLDALRLTDEEGAHQNLVDQINKWANNPSRLPTHARSAIQKAGDIQKLANTRLQLAQMYRQLEDPAAAKQIFVAQAKYEQTAKEEIKQAAKEAAKEAAAPKPAVVPTPTPAPAPGATAGTAGPDPAGDGYSDSLFGPGTGAPQAANGPATGPAAPTPGVTHRITLETADGVAEALSVEVDSNGTPVSMHPTGADGKPDAGRYPYNEQKVTSLAAKHQATITAKFAALGIAPAAAAVDTSKQDAAIDTLEKWAKSGDAPAYVNGQYVFPQGHPKEGQPYVRVSSVSKDLLGKDEYTGGSEYADRGNAADLFIRDFFIAAKEGRELTAADAQAIWTKYVADNAGRTKTAKDKAGNAIQVADPVQVQLTDNFFKELAEAAKALKATLDLQGYQVFSATPSLYGELDGKLYVGTMDLVLVGLKGELYIADLKTGQDSRRKDYKKPDIADGIKENKTGINGPYTTTTASKNRESDLVQQAMYKELFEQRTGLKVSGRLILPMIVNVGGMTAHNVTLEPENGGLFISLDNQGALGKLDIKGLIKHYTGKDVAPTPTPSKGGDFRSNFQLTGIGDNKAKLVLKPGTTLEALLQSHPAEMAENFDVASGENLEIASDAIFVEVKGNWQLERKGRIAPKAAAEATPADLLEQLNTRISASEDLSTAPGYQAWKAAVLSGTHTGAYELVWDGGNQYNVTTTVNGKEVKLGYLKGFRAVNAAKSTSAEFNARIEATIAFKAAIAAKYKKGERIPLRMAIAASNPDNLFDENGQRMPVTVDSPTLAGMDSRYQYEGAWHVVEWRKPYKMTELFTPILGQFSDEDRRVIREAGKKNGTDGYLVKVPMPGSILGYLWVGLNTLPVDGDAYGAIYDALLAGKAGTATTLANAYFAATTQRDGTHLKFYDDNIVLLSNDEDNTTINTLRPIKGAARPTDLASFKAAFKAEQGDAAGVLNYVGHQVSKDMAQDAILPLLVPNTSQQLWQTFSVTPVGVAAGNVAEPLVVLSPGQEKAAPEKLPALEMFQNTDERQEKKQEDIAKPGIRPLEEREADMDLWPDEELEEFFERQASQPTKKFGDDDSDYYIRPVDAARGDAASRLRPANWKKISKRLSAILPAGISLRRMEELATRLALSGREIGAFWKDAVYLADNLLKGVEYHEAFHALMATVFTAEEYAKATRLGKSRTDLSKAAVAQFLAAYPEYAGRSLESVKHQMVKETLANSFQDFMNNKPGILARLFQKLKEWLGLAQQHQDELLDLFAEIDRGGFKHRKVRLSAEAAEFKSLPNAQVAQSQKIVDLFVVRLWNKVNASGLPADKKEQWEPLLEELIRERMLEDAVPLAGVSSESMEQQHLAGLTAEQRKVMGGSLRSLYRKVYIAPESITAIKQQVGQAWALIKRSVQQPAAEDSLATEEPKVGVDTSSTDDMAERLGNNGSIMDVDTIGNMDEAVKLFIRYTTVGEGKGEQVIEFAPTVGMMFRNLENLRTLDAMRARLREIVSEEGNPQLAAVVARLEAAFMGPNGEVFGNRFRGAFYKSFLDSDDVKVNKAGGSVKLYDSDGEGISKRRIKEFNTAFTDYEGDRKAGLATLKDAADALRGTPDEKVIAAFERALAVIGLDLHPGFIRNVAKGRNAQYALDSKDGGKRSLLDDVLQLAQLASSSKNPYETTAGEEATGGGLARAAQLAKADALWQPGLVNSSFTGADGKPKYPFVAPSEVLERSRDIADGTVTFTSAEDALNPLVQMEQQSPGTLAKLRLRNYGGVSEENSEGQAFNALDPKSYLVGALALYRKGKLQLTQFEAKSTNLLFNRPGNARLTAEDGSIKEAAMGYLRSFYQQDLVVNQQVQQRLDDIAAINVSKPGGQEARYQALMGLEKNHDYKDLGPDNLPVLTTKEQVESAYALPEGADRDKAIASLPRGLQLVQLPGVNSLTMAERADPALVDAAIQAELAGAEAAFYELLADNELAIDNKESLALLTGGQKLELYDGKLQNYLREFLLQDFIYRNSYSQLLRGNESHFKDALDITKRAAGLLAAGPNAGEGHYNMAVLATDNSYLNRDLVRVELPADVLALRATDSKKFKQYLKDNELHENDDTDASGHILDTRHLDLHRRLGNLTPRAEQEMLALIAGEEVVNWDPEASGWNAISWKNVVYGANSPYVKTAGTPLFVQGCGVSMGKNFTPAEGQRAYVSPSGNVWVADVKAERLFNLFMQMKEQGIDEVYHDTAIKKGLKGQNFRGADGRHGVDGVMYIQKVANADWRQQQENPSGKQKVIDGTQMLQLLDSNMDGALPVTYGGQTKTVEQWRKDFQTAKAAIRKSDEDKAFNLLDAYVNGNPLFQQAVVSALEASGADQNTLDFFASAKDGSRHSMDLAHLNAKFQQIFLAHFNKNVFSQKVPGNKATHIPDSMRQLVVDEAGNLAHDFSKADKDQAYLDKYGRLKKDAGYTVRPLRMHTAVRALGDAKIIFGHPGIGKSFLKEQGRTDVIDFDGDYKSRINEELGLEPGFKARAAWRADNPDAWNEKVRELWQQAKQEAKDTDKRLLASDMILLREFPQDFDKVVTMSKDTFVGRAKQRDDYTEGETESWKDNLDKVIAGADQSKVMTTDKYMSDLLPENGVTGISHAEVIISEEFLVQNKITKEQLYSNNIPAAVRDKLLTMLGYRIPTQAHHSMLPFKVVGWLPAYYGSVVVTPGGITYLSGTDFDVDSLFIMRHAFSYDKKQGLHIYEGESTPAARFAEYLKYEETNNKAYKSATATLLTEDADYQDARARQVGFRAQMKALDTDGKQDLQQMMDALTLAQPGSVEEAYLLGEFIVLSQYKELATAMQMERQIMQPIEQRVREQVLTILQQPATLEEFSSLPEAEQQSNYVRQNQALTASMALLMNPHNWDAMKTPASTERGNKVIDQLEAYSGRVKRRVLPYNHLATQFSHWLANVTGKDNLGIVALTNTAAAFATKAGLQLSGPIAFFGRTLEGFAGLMEQDVTFTMGENGRLMAVEAAPAGKFDTTSLHVSQMADNVKEQAAARGNLSEEIIPQAGIAGALGAGYNRTELMTFQPVMWELSRRVAGLKNNWGQKKKTSASVLKDLLAEVQTLLGDKADGGFQPTAQQALDALPFRLPKKGAALSAEAVQHLNTQLYTLRVYGQLQGVQEALGHVSTTLGLTKGVGGSLQDLDRKQASVNYATGKLTQLNINDARETELLLAQNLNTLDRLQNVLGGNFLLRIRQVRERLLALRENSKTAGKQFYGMKEKDFANMELEYLSFLTINAFQQDFKQRYEGYTLASFQGLLNSETTNIVARTQQLLGAKAEDGVTDKYPGLRQNPLLRALTRVKPGAGNLYYGMSYNSRTKSESDYLEKQTDAFVELLSHPAKEVADYANALIMYLAVKNNFQFRSGSFIKVLPALKLEKTSQLLKQVKSALQSGDSNAVKALTGYGDSEGFRQFSRHYFSHPETRKLVGQLPRLEDAKLGAKLRKDSTAGLVVLDTDNLSEEEQGAMQDAGWDWDKQKGWAFPDFYADEDYETKDTIIYEKVGERRDNGQAYRATYRVLQPNYKAKQQTPYHLSPEAAINANAKPLPLDLEQEETGTSARVSRNGQTITPIEEAEADLPAAAAAPAPLPLTYRTAPQPAMDDWNFLMKGEHIKAFGKTYVVEFYSIPNRGNATPATVFAKELTLDKNGVVTGISNTTKRIEAQYNQPFAAKLVPGLSAFTNAVRNPFFVTAEGKVFRTEDGKPVSGSPAFLEKIQQDAWSHTHKQDFPKQVGPATKAAGPQQSFTFPDGTVISTGELALNGQQQDALTKLANYVLGGTESAMTLQGYAGTGKTTITKFFLAWLDKKGLDVEMSTPTHRAKTVLEKLSGREAMTMHKMLGLRADVTVEELNMNDLKFKREGGVMIPVGGVVIIDEASMVNDALYGALLEAAKQQQARVIFIGDIGQIKPVEQNHVSKVFGLDKSELTQVMRQKGGNPLGPILDLIRSDQQSSKDLFAHQTQLNEQGEGVIFSNSGARQRSWIEDNFGSKEFADNKDHARVLAGTNDEVQDYNHKIRKVIYGKEQSEEHEYLAGDLLTGYANWNQGRDGKSLITNSVDYEVVGARPVSVKLAGIDTTGFSLTTHLVGNKRSTQSFYMLSQQTSEEVLKALYNHTEKLRQTALNSAPENRSKAWVAYYDFMRSFATPRAYKEQVFNPASQEMETQTKLKKTLDYGYALTTHKSQGGTFTNAMVLEDDIDKAFYRDSQLRNQIKYVAFSRVANQLFVVSSKAEAAASVIAAVPAAAPAAAISATVDLSSSTKKVAPHFAKDTAKFSVATKLISRGSALSSSAAYAVAAGDKANSGVYASTDIVGISAEGKRTNRIAPDFTEIQKAMDANVRGFITDTATHRQTSFNVGEREVEAYLESHGYTEVNGSGKWVRATQGVESQAGSTAAPTDQQNEDISDLNDDFMPMGTAVNNPLEYWAAMEQSDTARTLYEDTPYVEQTQTVLERRFGAGVTSNGTAISLDKAFVFLEECGSALSKSLSTTLQSAVQAINPLLQMSSTTRKGGTLPHGGVTLGWYNPGDNTLGLNLEYTAKQDPKVARAQLVETLNHELLHAVTYQAVEQDPAFSKQILDLMARVQAASPASAETYAMSSHHEFITAVFTDPNFQGLLATIPGNRVNTTVWQEFVKALKILLAKYGAAVEDNLLEESVATISSHIHELARSQEAMANEQLTQEDYNFYHQPVGAGAMQDSFAQANKVDELPAAGQDLFHHWMERTLPERHQDSDATKLFFIKQYLADKIKQVCLL